MKTLAMQHFLTLSKYCSGDRLLKFRHCVGLYNNLLNAPWHCRGSEFSRGEALICPWDSVAEALQVFPVTKEHNWA